MTHLSTTYVYQSLGFVLLWLLAGGSIALLFDLLRRGPR